MAGRGAIANAGHAADPRVAAPASAWPSLRAQLLFWFIAEATKGNSMNRNTIAAASVVAALCAGLVIGESIAAQPHMQDALDHLMRARAELVAASADKGGHRLAAIRYVDGAVRETRAGMEYDRTH
jgi:hypothetical protein